MLPSGTLVAFYCYVHNFSMAGTTPIRLQIWRPEDLANDVYSLQTEVRIIVNLNSPTGTLYKVSDFFKYFFVTFIVTLNNLLYYFLFMTLKVIF